MSDSGTVKGPAAGGSGGARPKASTGGGVTKKNPAKKGPAKNAATETAPAKKSAAKTAAKKSAPAKTAAPSSATTADKAPAKAPAKAPTKAAAKKTPVKKTAAAVSTTPTKKGSSAGPSERDVRESRYFKRAQKRARKVLQDPEQMRQVAAEAADKSKDGRTGPLSKIFDELSALIRLVVAYARGNYRQVSGQTMVIIVAGLLYFVSPIDVIPDFLPGGYVDDALVLGWVVRTVRGELDAFIEWETGAQD